MIQNQGHIASFMSADPTTGGKLHDIPMGRHYPDWPVKVSWLSPNIQSLWMPLQRVLIDGRGQTVQGLGQYDHRVTETLHAGTSKTQPGVQALGLDLCGDHRQELVLYQPFQGERLFVFTQADSNGDQKPYVPQKQAYNMRSVH